jgi:hypothetical protein
MEQNRISRKIEKPPIKNRGSNLLSIFNGFRSSSKESSSSAGGKHRLGHWLIVSVLYLLASVASRSTISWASAVAGHCEEGSDRRGGGRRRRGRGRGRRQGRFSDWIVGDGCIGGLGAGGGGGEEVEEGAG